MGGHKCVDGKWTKEPEIVDTCDGNQPCYFEGQKCKTGPGYTCRLGKWQADTPADSTPGKSDYLEDQSLCPACFIDNPPDYYCNSIPNHNDLCPGDAGCCRYQDKRSGAGLSATVKGRNECIRKCKKANASSRMKETRINRIDKSFLREGTMLTTVGGGMGGKVLGIIPSKGKSGMVNVIDAAGDSDSTLIWSLDTQNRLTGVYDKTADTTSANKMPRYISGKDHNRGHPADLDFNARKSVNSVWEYNFDTGNLEMKEWNQAGGFSKKYALCASSDGSQDLVVGNLSQDLDGGQDRCKWVSTDIIPYCCTADENDPDAKRICGDYAPGKGGNSMCSVAMTALCGVEYNSDICQKYINASSSGNKKDASDSIRESVIQTLNKKLGKQSYDSSKHSTDPFFKTDMPALAEKSEGVLDTVLDTMCSYFTKEDLQKDPTLKRLCGCHLSTGATLDSAPKNMLLQPRKGVKNQYTYGTATIGSRECDPVCNLTDTIQRKSGRCKGTQCIIDGFSVDARGSQGTSVNLDLNCGNCKDSSCQCYIGDFKTNFKNSKYGLLKVKQNCGECFAFDSTIGESRPIDCETLEYLDKDGKGTGDHADQDDIDNDDGPARDESDIPASERAKSWIMKNKLLFAGIIGSVFIVIILLILLVSIGGSNTQVAI